MKAALYARVSTGDQRSEPQLDALRAFATARGWSVTEYVDAGESGVKASRPALDRMLADARAGRVDVVVAVRLDRLGRTVRGVVELAAELDTLGIGLVLTDQQMDTTTPAGRLLMHVLAAVGEMERALLIERTRAGIAAARARGRQPGRPRALDARQVAEVRRLRAAGWSIRRIASKLDAAPSTVGDAARQRTRSATGKGQHKVARS